MLVVLWNITKIGERRTKLENSNSNEWEYSRTEVAQKSRQSNKHTSSFFWKTMVTVFKIDKWGTQTDEKENKIADEDALVFTS